MSAIRLGFMGGGANRVAAGAYRSATSIPPPRFAVGIRSFPGLAKCDARMQDQPSYPTAVPKSTRGSQSTKSGIRTQIASPTHCKRMNGATPL